MDFFGLPGDLNHLHTELGSLLQESLDYSLQVLFQEFLYYYRELAFLKKQQNLKALSHSYLQTYVAFFVDTFETLVDLVSSVG